MNMNSSPAVVSRPSVRDIALRFLDSARASVSDEEIEDIREDLDAGENAFALAQVAAVLANAGARVDPEILKQARALDYGHVHDAQVHAQLDRL